MTWRTSTMPLSEIQQRVEERKWHHAFEIAPGIVTPGGSYIDPQRTVSAYGVANDLGGMTALDIGTFDGPYAFELERRGARVTAIDIQPPDVTAFNTAKAILGSDVRYIQGSVYDLPDLLDEKFDVIFYPGVYYHLKHPILAFEQIAKVLKDDGKVHLIGECLISYAEGLDGSPIVADWIEKAAASDVPICLSYPGRYKGVSNWFVPNVACMKSWLLAAGLKLEKYDLYHAPQEVPYPHQRFWGTAAKIGSPVQEHPIVGKDEELRAWRR